MKSQTIRYSQTDWERKGGSGRVILWDTISPFPRFIKERRGECRGTFVKKELWGNKYQLQAFLIILYQKRKENGSLISK